MRFSFLFRLAFAGYFSCLLSNAYCQITPDELIGTWEGKFIIGTPPVKTKIHGGIQDDPLYDSCYAVMEIQGVKGSGFYGRSKVYIISDPKGSYCVGEVSGFIKNNSLVFFRPRQTDYKLLKYPGKYWCKEEATATLSRSKNGYFMNIVPISEGCANGNSYLKKTKGFVPPTEQSQAREEAAKSLPPTKGLNLIKNNETGLEKKKAVLSNKEIEHSTVANSEKDRLSKMYHIRKPVIMDTIEVDADTVLAKFYDNATVDDDIISVFVNDQPIVMHKRLTDKAFSVSIALNRNLPMNKIAMFAENLGSIPPNTALMVISTANKKWNILMKCDLSSNAMVNLKTKPIKKLKKM